MANHDAAPAPEPVYLIPQSALDRFARDCYSSGLTAALESDDPATGDERIAPHTARLSQYRQQPAPGLRGAAVEAARTAVWGRGLGLTGGWDGAAWGDAPWQAMAAWWHHSDADRRAYCAAFVDEIQRLLGEQERAFLARTGTQQS